MIKRLIETKDGLYRLLGMVGNAEVISLDTETRGLDWHNTVVAGVAISWDKGCSAYISVNHADSPCVTPAEVRHTLNAILETPALWRCATPTLTCGCWQTGWMRLSPMSMFTIPVCTPT